MIYLLNWNFWGVFYSFMNPPTMMAVLTKRIVMNTVTSDGGEETIKQQSTTNSSLPIIYKIMDSTVKE